MSQTSAKATSVVIALVGLATLVAPACSKRKGQSIRVDGSSTVFLISQVIAEDFSIENGTPVTVAGSGTGAGFKKFCRGEVTITGASRPIKKAEIEDCKKAGIDFIELPVAYDGLAVVVNVKNTWVDSLTVAELKKIWEPSAQGRIMNWKDVREGFPDRPLRLFGPGTDSGTFDYFTAAVVGEERKSRGDFNGSENDNQLITNIAMDDNALGYFGFAYYDDNRERLKLIPVDDGKPESGDKPVLPSMESIADGTYQPLSRPIFIYVSLAATDRPVVDKFVKYYLLNAPKVATSVGYVPLPDKVTTAVQAHYEKRKVGTLMAAFKPGMTMDQVLAAEGASN